MPDEPVPPVTPAWMKSNDPRDFPVLKGFMPDRAEWEQAQRANASLALTIAEYGRNLQADQKYITELREQRDRTTQALAHAIEDRDRAQSALAALNGFLDPTRARVIALEGLLETTEAARVDTQRRLAELEHEHDVMMRGGQIMLAVWKRRARVMEQHARRLLCLAKTWREHYRTDA